MIVRFATTCDVKGPNCKKRSEEYTSFPTCRECSREVCLACAVPGSMEEVDRDRDGDWGVEAVHYETVLCPECDALLKEAEAPTLCAGTCGKPVTAPEKWCAACWPAVFGDHSSCSRFDHIRCAGCGDDICLTDMSKTRAGMYRLTPMHPSCKAQADPNQHHAAAH